MSDECPDNPGTGDIYHCKSHDCPVHGERNIAESKQASWCVYCGGESCGAEFCSFHCRYLFYHKRRES